MTDDTDKLDFLLIKFLLTLVETKSMQQTAYMLNLSHSGASRKLARANQLFGCELFIRSGYQMIPSTRMNEIQAMLERLLRTHEALFAPPTAFDPSKMHHTFTVATMDHGIAAILAPSVSSIVREAPNVRVDFIESKNTSWMDLRMGEVDLLCYPSEHIPSDFDSLSLYECDYALMVRKQHPLVALYKSKGCLTSDEILKFPRVAISVNRHTENSEYELSPIASIEEQRTQFSLPYFLAAPMLLSETDCTLQMPSVSAHFLARTHNLVVIPTKGLGDRHFKARLVWHRSRTADPGHQWLRSMIAIHARNFAKQNEPEE